MDEMNDMMYRNKNEGGDTVTNREFLKLVGEVCEGNERCDQRYMKYFRFDMLELNEDSHITADEIAAFTRLRSTRKGERQRKRAEEARRKKE